MTYLDRQQLTSSRSRLSPGSIKQGVFAAALLVAIAACSEPSVETMVVADPSTLLSTPQGPLIGSIDQYGSQQWLGIPYAQAPVDNLRWRAPRPHLGWNEERAALTVGTPCAQYGSALAGANDDQIGAPLGGEDCLYLNVWRPVEAAAALPVMVWIHGGSNVNGHGGFYQGGNLAATQKVVAVTLNYRMGPFGWFLHPSMGAGGNNEDASGNYGTLDLVQAMKWVQENISAYGGDPSNVTIFGESAGGTNIYSLLLSPHAENLFHKAIIQSGGVSFSSVANATNLVDHKEPGDPSSANEIVIKLLQEDGLASDRESATQRLADMSNEEVAQYLRSQPTWKFYNNYLDEEGTYSHYSPRVIADGDVIRTGDPLALLADLDSHNSVPVLVGTNRDEPKMFMAFNEEHVQRAFGLPLYPHDSDVYDLRGKYGGLAWKRRAVDAPSAALSVNQRDIFAYRWDWDEQGTRFGFLDLTALLGAAHGLEIPFVFGHWDIGPQSDLLFGDDGEQERLGLSAAMMSYWSNFAYTGNPGRGRNNDLPAWQAWNSQPNSHKMMILDSVNDLGIRMSTTEVDREFLVQELAEEQLSDKGMRCTVFDELFRNEPDQAWVSGQRSRVCS